MSENILNALVQLFALVADIHDETVLTGREKEIVRSFLSRHLNNELVSKYMHKYEENLGLYASARIEKGSVKDRKRTSLNAMRILAICEKINEELQQKQKMYVLIQLTDYISQGPEITENESDFLKTVAAAFYVPEKEYDGIMNFIMREVSQVPEKNEILILCSEKPDIGELKFRLYDKFRGRILFLHISSTDTYIMRYEGEDDIYLNGQNITAGQTYIFDRGSVLRGYGINAVYYSEIVSLYSATAFDYKITLSARDVNLKFRNSENGIHNLNLYEESGKLVGILGGSGVGKSTTLGILNGTLRPDSGKVLINGYDLYDDSEKEALKGVIGYVPQDDLLIDELTVFQNIYFNARMCLSNLSEENIIEAVNRTLADFDLEEIKDLRVGNPLRKIISGGQRKRINIALELLREPTILFVDEPTSGLSSVDSEAVMNLLRDQTYKGKMVIVNIHQPGSDIYKMFDRVMFIDRGGYQVFYGDPSEAVVYFRKISNHANPDEDQCVKCGNINTDQVLQIIESKVVDERGKPTRIRKITPQEWAQKFKEKYAVRLHPDETQKQDLPPNSYSIPGLVEQSLLFFKRDLLSKISDKQYMLISLLGAPILAFLLAYFTRFSGGQEYKFSENQNITAYMFMCVITAMFFGLMSSSEEIVRDRKILKRESFLHLSWFSYINSKVLMMFMLSAIQTFLFVLIGNITLGIKGMLLSYWLVLFTTSCFANILGLNISSAFSSVVTIYILIPFIIIPQLLFSGVLVKFDRLHISKFAQEYVPVIGDLMTARWSFEALAVEQFSNNKFEKPYFKFRMDESQNDYYASYLIDALIRDLGKCTKIKDDPAKTDSTDGYFTKLNGNIELLSDSAAIIIPAAWRSSLNPQDFNDDVAKSAAGWLEELKRPFRLARNRAMARSDIVTAAIVEEIGTDGLVKRRTDYENTGLRELVLDRMNLQKTQETIDKIIQKHDPAYMKATSKYGRAHFYAPVKRLGNTEIATYLFNMAVVWIVSLLLYVALYYNLLRRLIDFTGNIRAIKIIA
ncbi:MAG: ATP-binding cassette domain-containing protein [Bacteroidales bacterium]|nr:ATP-binding cassette domain-containing protein [Bacteroidales bacterium]